MQTATPAFSVSGCNGRMGKAVLELLAERGYLLDVAFGREAEPDLTGTDILIDFSTPEASLALLKATAQASAFRSKPLVHVIGTTGFTAADDDAVRQFSDRVVIVKSGSYSLGLNLLVSLLKQATTRLSAEEWDVEIFEVHHNRKIDAPSGTALMLGEAAAEGREQRLSDVRAAPYDGIIGARRPGSIGFSSARAGGIIGEHSATLAAEDEIITLSHSARSRTMFARGALTAGLWGMNKTPGLYDMMDVLGFGLH